MYKEIIALIGGVFLSMIWIHLFKVPIRFYKIFNRRLVKPFGCGFCLSFWLSFFFLLNLKTNFIDAIFICSIAPFLYLYFEDYITNKWHL